MTIEGSLAALHRRAPEGIETAVLLGTGLIDGYGTYDSAVGRVLVVFNPAGVSAVDLADDEAPTRFETRFGRRMVPARPPKGWDVKIGRALEQGRPGDLALDLRAQTGFQRAVLAAAAGIPRGEVRAYGWLAAQVGHPSATRAVGSTMARNPVPLIIPCHRVVRADGRIGKYSLGGPDKKWDLLRHEGADPEQMERLASRGVRYFGSDTTHIYCHPTCRHARRTTAAHTVEFGSAAAAGVAGYRPCRVCRP